MMADAAALTRRQMIGFASCALMAPVMARVALADDGQGSGSITVEHVRIASDGSETPVAGSAFALRRMSQAASGALAASDEPDSDLHVAPSLFGKGLLYADDSAWERSVTGSDGRARFEGLADGIYAVIEVPAESRDEGTGTQPSVVTLPDDGGRRDIVVRPKDKSITSSKKIDDSGKLLDEKDAGQGDVVTFRISTQMPWYVAKEGTAFAIVDDLDSRLSFSRVVGGTALVGDAAVACEADVDGQRVTLSIDAEGVEAPSQFEPLNVTVEIECRVAGDASGTIPNEAVTMVGTREASRTNVVRLNVRKAAPPSSAGKDVASSDGRTTNGGRTPAGYEPGSTPSPSPSASSGTVPQRMAQLGVGLGAAALVAAGAGAAGAGIAERRRGRAENTGRDAADDADVADVDDVDDADGVRA